MKIVRLTAENIKCLSAITIEPDPEASVVTVGGLNGAGKSTALDSIEYALGGVRGIPAVPIRTGETKARAILDLDAEGDFPAMHVERRFSVKGGSELIVTTDGKRLSSPQAILDSLQGRVGFDPLAFTREKPAEQRRILQGLVGLDFTEADTRRATVFEQRTAKNGTVKELKGQLAGMEVFDDAPAEETSASALIEEIQAVNAANAENDKLRLECVRREDKAAEQAEGLARLTEQLAQDKQHRENNIARMEADLAEAKKVAEKNTTENNDFLGRERMTLDKYRADVAAATAVSESLADQPTGALQEQLEKCEETNRQVRANAALRELTRKLGEKIKAADVLTGQIERIDEEKQSAMESAEWPVEGLGFSDDGVTLNGLPFEQASQAQSIDVSVAMGFAANPMLRVMLIRDASLLDNASLARIAKLAEEKDGQVWLERVGEGDCSVVIRDGEVVQTET